MTGFDVGNMQTATSKFPKTNDEIIKYGTAGFRTNSSKLDYVLFRMGCLAGIRSQSKQGLTIGMMITASHNPEQDNGVKLVDPEGEMLNSSWEAVASKLTLVSDADFVDELNSIIADSNVPTNVQANIYIARDTRESSERLSNAAIAGATAYGANIKDYGILTTPQLHFMVRCVNSNGVYGDNSEQGYYTKLSAAFNKLNQTIDKNYTPIVTVDGANGVGSPKLKQMSTLLKGLQIQVVNDGSTGKLNHECGADYVKIQQSSPIGMGDMLPNRRYASFDGDADRIVYFFTDNDSSFHLLDGDKIATLIASYLRELVESCDIQLKFGVVQTAYANGASTAYICESLKIAVACACTGVKHLHHEALNFDIGVYFEANGHGTVIFSDTAKQMILQASKDQSKSQERRNAATTLLQVIELINETVGDAISDLLLVETILNHRGIDVKDWNVEYTDLPNRQVKVKVADRSAITTTNAERTCVSPRDLQPAIDLLVKAAGSSGRSFVRPSGTEDVVRVYAEASTREMADKLASDVRESVIKLAGGIE